MNIEHFSQEQRRTAESVKELTKKINELHKLQGQLHAVRNACEHIVIKNTHNYGASCQVCNKIFDMPYCEISPINLCQYTYYDGVSNDDCVHCKASNKFF